MELSDYRKRIFLFLFGCIIVRLIFVHIAKNINAQHLPYLGALALIPVMGWLYIYFIGSRDTGPEVFGGTIWWNELRPIHAALYSLFALYAFQMKSYSYVPLLFDTLFGLASFVIYHFKGF